MYGLRIFQGKNYSKGFALFLLILGIAFIIVLGGVGLGVVQTQQKVSKALSEVQKLEEEGKNEEAIKKLEGIENNFLVKYFGFKKEEIDQEIEKNEKLLEEKKVEVVKPKEEEEKPEEKEEKSAVIDCQDNLDCLIESAKNCNLAKVKDTISLKVGSYVPTISLFAEIKGKENEKCVFYIRGEKLIDLQKEGLSQEKLEEEKEKWRPFIEGSEEICYFENEDLVKWLETVKEGELPSFKNAQCKYHGLELKLLEKLE